MIEKIVAKWIHLWSMSLLAYPQHFCKWKTIMEACSVGGVQRRRLGYEVMRHRASLAKLQIPGNYQHPSDNRRYPSVCVQSSFDACPHQGSHGEPGIIVGLSSWSSTLLYSWFLNLHCLYFLILPDWPLPRPLWSRQSTKNGRNICKGTEQVWVMLAFPLKCRTMTSFTLVSSGRSTQTNGKDRQGLVSVNAPVLSQWQSSFWQLGHKH